ncbi:CCA tRNA nucleotidyltransferase, mitochondrial, partial [Rhizophlyctis rosea]
MPAPLRENTPTLTLQHTEESTTAPQITLTPSETKLFDLLVGATEYVRRTYPEAAPITLRVAGGWVRDKLLGLDSSDIDIAIDTMTGEPFAKALKAYMLELPQSSSGAQSDMVMSSIATIQVNPEKSKHLETATAKVMGLMIDFVHLRTEKYGTDSRNPVVDFGTPLEDALRRDITINALFYNLHTRQIEDFTNEGLPDLRIGLIRTPLPPLQTFIDDPLRVLRVIRFATRFQYSIHPDIVSAVARPEIRESFVRKITRERIGVEVDKMMRHERAVEAMEWIREFGFWGEVFGVTGVVVPPKVKLFEDEEGSVRLERLDGEMGVLASRIARSIIKDDSGTLFPQADLLPTNSEARRALYLSCAALPLHGLKYRNKDKLYPLARFIILDGLKFSSKDADTATYLSYAIDHTRDMVHDLKSRGWQCDRKE